MPYEAGDNKEYRLAISIYNLQARASRQPPESLPHHLRWAKWCPVLLHSTKSGLPQLGATDAGGGGEESMTYALNCHAQ